MLNTSNLGNIDFNEIEEKNSKNRRYGWQMLALVSLLIAIMSLFGVWYINNQKMFLIIENNKLKLEVNNLKEDIAMLKALDIGTMQNNNDANPSQTGSNQSNNNQEGKNFKEYEIKPGDSLTSISLSFYGTEIYADKIAELNNITPESILQLGQKLKIPDQM